MVSSIRSLALKILFSLAPVICTSLSLTPGLTFPESEFLMTISSFRKLRPGILAGFPNFPELLSTSVGWRESGGDAEAGRDACCEG
uniref:Putative secreted protein n=1 Tax=Ixodes ricinus TaxID=34613 RepID=A0A6B0UFB0_IXORI